MTFNDQVNRAARQALLDELVTMAEQDYVAARAKERTHGIEAKQDADFAHDWFNQLEKYAERLGHKLNKEHLGGAYE